MTRIFKAVKPVHSDTSDTIDRHFKIKRRILLVVFTSLLISRQSVPLLARPSDLQSPLHPESLVFVRLQNKPEP
jgi:hypothetical protein